MKLTDRRLYQARNLEDFAFRYWFRDEDNRYRRAYIREGKGRVNAVESNGIIALSMGAFVSPDTNRIWGVDVSGRWDGLVDFRVTAGYGAKFAISKAIDGTVPTAYWKENNQSAYDAGLLNSLYAWLYPDNRINCTLQAQAFYNLVKDAKLRMPPILDFEWTRYAGIQANPNYTDLRKWLAPFIRLSGVKPILYTAAGYVALFGAIPADILDMLSGVHVASYGGTTPLLPKGVSKWDIWQFTANGDALTLAPGNQGKKELDLNYMTEEFYQRYAVTEPQEPGETMAKNKVTVTFDQGARERQQPHAAGIYRDILPDNSVHYSDFDPVPDMDFPTDPDKRWIKLQSGWYIAVRYPTSTGIVERARVEPVTPPADTVTANIDLDLTMDINGAQYTASVVLNGVQLRAA